MISATADINSWPPDIIITVILITLTNGSVFVTMIHTIVHSMLSRIEIGHAPQRTP